MDDRLLPDLGPGAGKKEKSNHIPMGRNFFLVASNLRAEIWLEDHKLVFTIICVGNFNRS